MAVKSPARSSLFNQLLYRKMELPTFRYHPNPVATGACVKQSETCLSCEKEVSHIYIGPTFSIHELDEQLCAWCIADGSANEKFDVEFSDPHPLELAGLPESLIEEVTTRTPGFICWQQPTWLTHCDDACLFVGDATMKVLQAISTAEHDDLLKTGHLDKEEFEEILGYYRPGGTPGIYHFRCMHCDFQRFGIEYP